MGRRKVFPSSPVPLLFAGLTIGDEVGGKQRMGYHAFNDWNILDGDTGTQILPPIFIIL